MGLSSLTYGQVRNVNGRVTDADTGNPIENVQVIVDDSDIFTKPILQDSFPLRTVNSSLALRFYHPDFEVGSHSFGGRSENSS
jgi:hypothetical protein